MGKNKGNQKEKKLSEKERRRQQLEAGISALNQHRLFGKLGGWICVDDRNLGKHPAFCHSDGKIYVNPEADLSAKKWEYILAHAKLHLAFGHFDAQRMPGYEKVSENGEKEWIVQCDPKLWNIACDIYIEKFLADMKYGKNYVDINYTVFPVSVLQSELQLYEYLLEYPENIVNNGTSLDAGTDMQWKHGPIYYNEKKKESNQFVRQFAFALADSVSQTIDEVSGQEITGQASTKSAKAANWFVSHYPLLGGLASGFKVIEDARFCIEMEISVAAVDVTRAEIYVNPAAGLNEEELKFVLAHEFLHAGLMHHERRQGRDPYLWNVVCDFVINGWLHQMQIGQMPENGLLFDENLRNISAESLYDLILGDLKKYQKLGTFRGYGKGDIMEGSGRTGNCKDNVTNLDEFYKSALRNGMEYHRSAGRGFIPAGLVEEIRALSMPPIPWDVELARWFDTFFTPLEKHRTYARPSRRQGSTPDIPRPSYVKTELPEHSRTFGVVIDTSGSMSTKLIGYALGAVASYASAKDVPYARVIFCDAMAYDIGYVSPEEIAGRVEVKGRGGTILQPAVNLLLEAKDFPRDGPILIITDGFIEKDLIVKREHAFLIPKGARLPFLSKGKVFRFD